MSTNYPWAESLGITVQDIAQWSSELPPEENVLEWGLLHGKIDPEAYLAWASETYEIPRLTPEFFSKLPGGIENLRSLINSTEGSWSCTHFPVHAWDGTIFVGGVAPTQQDVPYQVLLADPGDMLALWKKLNAETESVPVIKLGEIKDGNPEELLENVNEETGDLAPEGLALAVPSVSDEVELMPEGLSSNGMKDAKAEASSHQVPEGLEIQGMSLNSAPSIPDAPEDLTKPQILLKLHTNDSSKQPQDVPKEKEEVTQVMLAEPQVQAKATSAPESRAPKGTPTTSPPKNSPPPLKVVRDTVVDEVFQNLMGAFQAAMVFTFRQGKLVPWKWAGQWTEPETAAEINLATPSIFKIVADTKLPYHGYVVVNPVNGKFFADWTDGKIPAHVTLAPIINESNLIGMVLGLANADPQPRSTLILAERAAIQCTNSLASAA